MSRISTFGHSRHEVVWKMATILPRRQSVITLKPWQDGRHFPDDIFLSDNASISINISPKFVLKGPINNTSALVQRMAWRRPGDKPLDETNDS